MKQILFVTTNEDKFNKARINLRQHNIELIHKSLEMSEIQSSDGEVIVRDKAKQAFVFCKQPVLVNDDTWSIPALRGFPSTGMKLCNDFLVAEDWLRLMNGIEDRRVVLVSQYAYHDGTSIHTIMGEDERYFLSEARGVNAKSPCLEVIARVGSSMSVAEEISKGRAVEKKNSVFWKKLADLLMRNT